MSQDYDGLAMAEPDQGGEAPLLHAGLEVFSQVLQQTATLGELGCALGWLLARISTCTDFEFDKMVIRTVYERCCRPQIASSRGAIFPLPLGALDACEDALRTASLADVVTPHFVERWQADAWQFCVGVGLNAIGGKLQPQARGSTNKLQARAAAASRAAVERFLGLGGRSSRSPDEIRGELKGIRISYTGEEMGTCHKLTLDQVVPALPPGSHGASVDVMTLLSPGTQRLLLHPENLITKDVGQELPSLQARVHCSPGELLPLCSELVKRQICTWIPLEAVYKYRDQPVLSGLFGVEKPTKLDDGRSVLRLIMNLVPINSVMEPIAGCVRHLPSITSWLGISTEADDRLRLFQSDLSAAFYLFRLPQQWTRFLAFNVKVPGTELGLEDPSMHVLACRVIPMGWISSVALMQEVAEQVAYLGGAEEESQVTRGSSLPLFLTGCLHESHARDRPWWHVYLDNFCSGQRVQGDADFQKGQDLHNLVEDVWARTGLVSSAKKRVSGASTAQELGAWIDGDRHTISASGERFIRLVHATLYLLSCRFLNKKAVQIVIGRWVHVLQFRRPLMGLLTQVWKFISTPHPTPAVVLGTRQELWKLTLVTPLMHTFLGASIDDCTTASDASMKGGAVGIGPELSLEGKDFVLSSQVRSGNIGTVPILVISLFNGIGGCFRVYDVLDIRPLGMIAVELHKPAIRIVERRWPQSKTVPDVRLVDAALVKQWHLEYPMTEEVHIWAGFPCVDLSRVRANRQGLLGPSSSLVYEIPRIEALVKAQFGSGVLYKKVIENVSSMDRSAAEQISELFGVTPYELDSVDSVPMRRPRFTWCSEPLEAAFTDLEVSECSYWKRIWAVAEYPTPSQWVTPDWQWMGEETQTPLPTCMKSIPRDRPPLKPAGIRRCSPDTIQRWTSEEYRFPPYQYSPEYLFWQGDHWRVASSEERELLLGYGFGHTKLCLSASKQKEAGARTVEDIRQSMLGDSFSVYSFVIPGAALCQRFLPRLPYSWIARRMGIAPGFRAPLRSQAPLGRFLQYGFRDQALARTYTPQDLDRILLTKVNHTGSDIRIATGDVLNPKAFPRQGVEASWWNWRPVFNLRWKHEDHINPLELRAILLSIVHHVRRRSAVDARIFHVTDSYVSMSVIGKGRSGSRKLHHVLQQLNAHLMAFNLYLIIGHVESTENPTDHASRA